MEITGNTVLITGGGSGIGRALAEAFHAKGNQVIIAGRRAAALDEVTAANPGMESLQLDINDPRRDPLVRRAGGREFPALNVLVNNAGVMRAESLQSASPARPTPRRWSTTNLLGPIRLTTALLPHLSRRPRSSGHERLVGAGLRAACDVPHVLRDQGGIHSYTMSLPSAAQGDGDRGVEIAPPYVQTHLTGDHQANDPRAMPLDEFIAEVMEILSMPGVTEVVVERLQAAPVRGRGREDGRGVPDAQLAGVLRSIRPGEWPYRATWMGWASPGLTLGRGCGGLGDCLRVVLGLFPLCLPCPFCRYILRRTDLPIFPETSHPAILAGFKIFLASRGFGGDHASETRSPLAVADHAVGVAPRPRRAGADGSATTRAG